MAEQTLEFRGIPLRQLISYVLDLEGAQTTTSFPIEFRGPNWMISILKEQEVIITSRFTVNAVHIRFQAPSEDLLVQLISRFRLKTTRVGG